MRLETAVFLSPNQDDLPKSLIQVIKDTEKFVIEGRCLFDHLLGRQQRLAEISVNQVVNRL